MSAKSTQQRSAEAAERRRQKGIEDLRLPAPPGTRQQLADLMAWHGLSSMAEAMSLLILNAHALGQHGSAPLLAVPRHEITISASVARRLHSAGALAAAQLDASEQ
jgi:hypothetical protein